MFAAQKIKSDFSAAVYKWHNINKKWNKKPNLDLSGLWANDSTNMWSKAYLYNILLNFTMIFKYSMYNVMLEDWKQTSHIYIGDQHILQYIKLIKP